MKKALLIEFNLSTGKRAGNISPRDPNLPCHGWQDLESEPAREIRLVNDGRDLSRYKGITGITLLDGETEINQAIAEIVPENYFIQDEGLFQEHLRQQNIKLADYQGQNPQTILRNLHNIGIVGIAKRKIKKIKWDLQKS